MNPIFYMGFVYLAAISAAALFALLPRRSDKSLVGPSMGGGAFGAGSGGSGDSSGSSSS